MAKIPTVGLVGRFGSGKDTVATILVEQCGFVQLNLGDYVKAEMEKLLSTRRYSIRDLFNRTGRCLLRNRKHPENVWKKPTSASMRHLLQWWGTDVRRAQDPDYWVRLANARWWCLVHDTTCNGVVVGDIRFKNEVAWVKMLGGENWRIVRDAKHRTRYSERLYYHRSEHDLDAVECDRTFLNNGTVGDLQAAIKWRVNGGEKAS